MAPWCAHRRDNVTEKCNVFEAEGFAVLYSIPLRELVRGLLQRPSTRRCGNLMTPSKAAMSVWDEVLRPYKQWSRMDDGVSKCHMFWRARMVAVESGDAHEVEGRVELQRTSLRIHLPPGLIFPTIHWNKATLSSPGGSVLGSVRFQWVPKRHSAEVRVLKERAHCLTRWAAISVVGGVGQVQL